MVSRPVTHVRALLDRPAPPQGQAQGRTQALAHHEPLDALAPVHHGKFTFTSAGLQVHGTPTFEEWAEVGGVLAVMERGLAFLIGDWIRYGETYGEKAAQIIDARSWRPETVRNYVWLAGKVPLENRMIDRGLSVAHHQVVAALPPPEQRKWLRRALDAENGDEGEVWTATHLKAAIRHGSELREVGWYVLVKCTSATKRDQLAKKLELDGHECRVVTKRGVTS